MEPKKTIARKRQKELQRVGRMKGELSVEMRVPKVEVVGAHPGQLKPPKSGGAHSVDKTQDFQSVKDSFDRRIAGRID